MKTYIGVKKIEAEPMTRGEYNVYRCWTILENENPEDAGYLVKYPDGYISWLPKKQFEDAYTEVYEDKVSLADTVLAMLRDSYKERFTAEYDQAVIRYVKLKSMLDKWDKGELTFKPTCPRSTYNMQIKAMTDYIAVLEARAIMEGIEL